MLKLNDSETKKKHQEVERLYDSHIHLNSDSLKEWFKKYHEDYKNWIFNNVSTNLNDFRIALEQAKSHDNVFVTAGIHPLEIDSCELSYAMEEIERGIKLNRNKIIAIGETGMDFYRADKTLCFEKQRRWFYAQYELARKYDLPLMLHIRNAHDEILDLLESVIDWRGIIHCFEGNEEIMNKYLRLSGNWMLSVSPIVLRETSKFRNLIHKLDINRILVESDAPFLGKDCKEILRLIQIIAKEKGIDFYECQKILWNNFCQCFKLKVK